MEESIFIGDSIAHDVTGAQNIGMPVILYRPKENVNEIEWLQTEKGKMSGHCTFFSVFLKQRRCYKKRKDVKETLIGIKRRHKKNMKLVEKVPKDLYKIFEVNIWNSICSFW